MLVSCVPASAMNATTSDAMTPPAPKVENHGEIVRRLRRVKRKLLLDLAIEAVSVKVADDTAPCGQEPEVSVLLTKLSDETASLVLALPLTAKPMALRPLALRLSSMTQKAVEAHKLNPNRAAALGSELSPAAYHLSRAQAA